MRKVLGVAMIVLAVVLAVVPIFSDCQSQGRALELANGRTVPMKCHWSGIAEAGVALPLALAGIYALIGRRKETTRFAAIIGVTSGALAILFPTVLIGVCAMDTMVCNLIMRPILIAAGALAILASTVLFFIARDSELMNTEAFA
jgi:hypothetical protein